MLMNFYRSAAGKSARLILFSAALLMSCRSQDRALPAADPETMGRVAAVTVFKNDMIHFSPEYPNAYETVRMTPYDNGREISTRLELPQLQKNERIIAAVHLKPVPKDIDHVHDPWDRAGNVRVKTASGIDVEIMRFMTAYGGETTWKADVTYLAPLLIGTCDISGFIDTWLSPGWRMDLTLSYGSQENESPAFPAADWVLPLWYTMDYSAQKPGNEGLKANVTIPEHVENVKFVLISTGHCTDGRADDEFITKDHILEIDGREVARLRPWRDDCIRFRSVNPYTHHWSNGDWSSDFERSGWCPGDNVTPMFFDLGTDLLPGNHDLKLTIKDVRPADENGHYGYWRVSALLVGQY